MPYLIRPATLEDAPEITALLNAIDVIEVGRPETDQHTVEADLKHPDTDLAHDSWLAFDGELLVVYGLLWDESEGERIDIDHYVLPEPQEAGRSVLAAMETRALEKARSNGAERAVVHLYLNVRATLDQEVLTARGWDVVRRYHVLHRPVDPEQDHPVQLPDGVRLRACVTEEDRRLVHALYQATFAEHFDFQPRTYEQWFHDVDGDRIDWSLVWIAGTGQKQDVGFLLARNDRTAMGWIRSIGVLREARGQGLAGLLLRHAFATFAELGRDTVGLGVDTDNTTGAPALYARHGMTVHFAVDTWEVTLT
ncbi:GNAT family N-acetyltransferase [Streptomyces acidiscabies]|uniref:GNAT family N-acetyltransferase n=1 Tax=Streptomyces acidiscabies TaxID=42234 RepID=A0AAP6BE63_9ACTN|nr:GNAT family N-acetyltransferase [Streptomyces acidiscabies]MBP5941707.1 GNAT family N-acetyltransferase [Streptomyces sp. LBUM 1476]MBZ3913117.1 GNAT family N-acetyltransferase [Streptomyces acidiscabies]MDX2962812.1 GNAT family N-acetyltransferase [Streptomyces acidiscabies]MDX3020890.1 GNAT family N-acetyltransferase [Streptomyces acidiscabies]MDX3790081.1 GNAT family N-acetyltransferase [Streptomyces acidiscabies]